MAVAVVAGTASEQAAQGRPASVANRVTRVLSSCTPNTPSRADLPLTNIHTHTNSTLALTPPLLPIPVLPLRYTLPFLFIPCQIPHTAHQQGKGTDSSSLSRRLPATSTTFFPEMIFTEINRYNGKKGKLISLFPGRQLSTSTSGITRGILIRVYGTVRRK